MKNLIVASPTILAALVFIAISLHAVYRARREAKIRIAECDRWAAEFKGQLAGRETAGWEPTAVLQLTLDLTDPTSEVLRVANDAERLIAGLSEYEVSLGGRGLVVTAAKAAPGQVILTLTPKDATGAGSRVERVAEALNAAFNPATPTPGIIPNLGSLPGDVSAAHAVALAA